jgi:endonuclease/exonuclease/phosphatase family metal-dependent hydrolase
VSFDPYAPYGPVVESTVRVVTWNVWGRYGTRHEARQAGLEHILAEAAPDVICLIEAWRHGGSDQPERVAERLGLPYHHFAGDWQQEDWVSGIGLVCRWPMSEPQRRSLHAEDGTGNGQVLHVAISGERGPIQLFAVMLDYPLDGSATRQDQVRQLVRFVSQVATRRDPVIVCGDFKREPGLRRDQDAHRTCSHGRSAHGVLRQLGDGR